MAPVEASNITCTDILCVHNLITNENHRVFSVVIPPCQSAKISVLHIDKTSEPSTAVTSLFVGGYVIDEHDVPHRLEPNHTLDINGIHYVGLGQTISVCNE
ncbi:MAG: hypothetical protein V1917_02095 [Candidatus Gottesmanbacteria bacterium]